MCIDRIVLAFAGIVILASTAAFYMTGIEWILIIPAFVGANMLQAAFTRFCPLAIILKKLGARPGQAFN